MLRGPVESAGKSGRLLTEFNFRISASESNCSPPITADSKNPGFSNYACLFTVKADFALALRKAHANEAIKLWIQRPDAVWRKPGCQNVKEVQCTSVLLGV